MQLIQFVTILFGLLIVGFLVRLAYLFFRIKHPLSGALTWQLAGEALVGLVTCVFAVSSYLHVWNVMSPELATLLRWVIFAASGVTSWHLYQTIKKIQDGH